MVLMRLFLTMVCFCLIISHAIPASAAGFARVSTFAFSWDGIFVGGRQSALGGSDLTDSSPANFLANPSPLSRGDGVELSYDHADYLVDWEFSTFAGTVEWNSLRLSLAVQDFEVEDSVVRTSYNPEGTGETFDMRDRLVVMGVSYDLGSVLFDHPSLQWSVGGALRQYYTDLDESRISAGSFDLGTTVAWTMHYQRGWTGISGALSWQNIADSSFEYNERTFQLPQPMRAGVTLTTALDWSGHEGDLVKLLVSYTNAKYDEYTFRGESNHRGVEAIFFDTFAFRRGRSTAVYGGVDSWGVGVMLDGRLLGPFTAQVDVGEMEFGSALADEPETIWGLRVGYGF